MIESNLNLSINAEEHEVINVALTQLLESVEQLMYYIPDGENERIDLLRNLRNKSYMLWSERFLDYDSSETVTEDEQDGEIGVD